MEVFPFFKRETTRAEFAPYSGLVGRDVANREQHEPDGKVYRGVEEESES
jgi:hypothetical protein